MATDLVSPNQFIHLVKERFSATPDKYLNFLLCLQKVAENKYSPEEVVAEVQGILLGTDLFEKFCLFLPKPDKNAKSGVVPQLQVQAQLSMAQTLNQLQSPVATSPPPTIPPPIPVTPTIPPPSVTLPTPTTIPPTIPGPPTTDASTTPEAQKIILDPKQKSNFKTYLSLVNERYKNKDPLVWRQVSVIFRLVMTDPKNALFHVTDKLMTILKDSPDLVKLFSKFIPESQIDEFFKLFEAKFHQKNTFQGFEKSPNPTQPLKRSKRLLPQNEQAGPRKEPRSETPTETKRWRSRRAKEKNGSSFTDMNSVDLSNLDLDLLERCNISYCVLPIEAQMSLSSGRDALCNSVLNNSLMITIPRNVNYNISDPNQYAKVSLLIEEDQYELDLLIELCKSTINKLENALLAQKQNPSADFESSLSEIHKRCIQTLYGKTGAVTITEDVVSFLKDKYYDFVKSKNSWNPVWRTANKQVAVSLLNDYGDEFKETDKQSRDRKEFLHEVEWIHFEVKNKILLPSTGYRPPVPPAFPPLKLHIDIQSNEEDSLLTDLTEDYDMHFSLSPSGIIKNIIKILEVSGDLIIETSLLSTYKHFLKIFGSIFFHFDMPTPKESSSEIAKITQLSKAAKGQPFIGDFNFHYFFRLFQLLHFRLVKAQVDSKFNSSTFDWNQHLPPKPSLTTISHFKSFDTNINYTGESTSSIPAELYRNPGLKYNALLEIIVSLLNGNTSTSSYEEFCMVLFGPKSWYLFGIDGLIIQITKQIKAILSNPLSKSLISLYENFLQKMSNNLFVNNADTLSKLYEKPSLDLFAATPRNEKWIFKYYFEEDTLFISIKDSVTLSVPSNLS